jgi:hypothetical protein
MGLYTTVACSELRPRTREIFPLPLEILFRLRGTSGCGTYLGGGGRRDRSSPDVRQRNQRSLGALVCFAAYKARLSGPSRSGVETPFPWLVSAGAGSERFNDRHLHRDLRSASFRWVCRPPWLHMSRHCPFLISIRYFGQQGSAYICREHAGCVGRRHDEISQIDRASPTTTSVKLKCGIPPRLFTDHTCFLKVEGTWQVTQKVFFTEFR